MAWLHLMASDGLVHLTHRGIMFWLHHMSISICCITPILKCCKLPNLIMRQHAYPKMLHNALFTPKRWMPELFTTSATLLASMLRCPLPPTIAARCPGQWSEADFFPAFDPSKTSRSEGDIGGGGVAPRPLRFASLATDSEGSAGCVDEAAALYAIVRSIGAVYASLPSCVEVCTATLSMVEAAKLSEIDPRLHHAHSSCGEQLRATLRKAAAQRLPLRMQRAAPVPLKQLNPAFLEDFQPDRSMDPDRERAQMAKLKKDTKKERKGAVRELRKDSVFLASQRVEQQQKNTAYLEERGKRAMGIMEDQEANWKSMKKEKRKIANKLL